MRWRWRCNPGAAFFPCSLPRCVREPRDWTWDELLQLPERTVFATVECAGNGRSFLQPLVGGVQWGAGAVGHAEWTGVPLRLVLEESGVNPETVEILCEGADVGSEADHPEPMRFARSLPLAKALHPDTLLAFRMNGELLEPAHGFPLRLFAPGWYGVASVKWLRRIEVLDRPFHGYYQSVKYTVQRDTPAGRETVVGSRPLRGGRNGTVGGVHALPRCNNAHPGNDPRLWRHGIPTYSLVTYRHV